jgi:aerobic-type carbon monoxide dehydrogenase small subunit (CoxS/CutS family)
VSDRVVFTCNDAPVDLACEAGESLLTVLRERLGLVSVKDGCAPQGQCGCCTVLVDGEPRVACVTPVSRVSGRSVTTVDGLAASERESLAGVFAASGGSQCGFCTPGILVRAAWLRARGKTRPVDVDRALAAHLCRCTGWQTIHEALDALAAPGAGAPGAGAPGRPPEPASRRAALEGGTAQAVGAAIALGAGGFADDAAPRDALVAVPLPPGSSAASVDAVGLQWVVGDTLATARALAGNVQGRRTTVVGAPPLDLPDLPPGGVRLATSWVEPAYLEPDASWCAPGGEPASPLANGGAFGGKVGSPAPGAARELADRLGVTVRVVFAREDVVRLGPKRPPISASARYVDGTVVVDGLVAGDAAPFRDPVRWPYRVAERGEWSTVVIAGPATSRDLRAVGLAERAVLLEGALDEAGVDRAALVDDDRAATVLLDACMRAPGGALAGARVSVDERGAIGAVHVRVAAGDPLDEVVLRSYAIGAAHMALGWVLSESLTVDRDTGAVHDLTIRSFGIIRAQAVPPITVEIIDEPGAALPRASDAVFAAVAATTWNAVARAEGVRPDTFPAAETRAARRLRG